MPGTKQSGRRKSTVPKAAVSLPAEGSQGKQRTPISSFDPAAGKDVYEPELIVAQRLAKGVTQFQVKWVGFSEKSNTWEPIEHLAGCEDMIVEFRAREKLRLEKVEAEAKKKQEEKEAKKSEELKDQAERAAARRLADQANKGDAPADNTAGQAEDAAKRGPPKGTRRTSPWWRFFSQEGCDIHYANCTLNKPGTNDLCNDSIKIKDGPTGSKSSSFYRSSRNLHVHQHARCPQLCVYRRLYFRLCIRLKESHHVRSPR